MENENLKGQIEIRPWVFFKSRNGKEKFKKLFQEQIDNKVITDELDAMNWVAKAYGLEMLDAKTVVDTYYKDKI